MPSSSACAFSILLRPSLPLCCPLSPAGKGKVGEEAGGGPAERPGLEVLLGLPRRAISRRSEAHLNQALEAS